MEARLKPPEYLSLQGNVAENWRRWHQRFELYMLAIETDAKPNRTKIAILLSAIGPDALERYNHFKWDDSPNDPPNNPPVPDDDNQQGNAQPAQNNAAEANDNRNVLRSDVYADVVKRFELEFVGEKRVVFARYRFWIYERTEEQHFDDYTTELHTLANACEFKEHENMIRDKIVFSMKDKRIQERLLREVKLSLKRAVDICKSSEVTRKEVQTMKKGPVESTKVVYDVNSKSRVKHKPKPASANYQYKKTKHEMWEMWKTAPSKKMSSMGKELPKMRWTKSFRRNVQDQVGERASAR